jgi:two-component system, OmpR family, KDP operon response regulator KdpE
MTVAMFRVLIVEDDIGIRTLIRMLLETEGYRVIAAESASRALVEARSHKPDLMIVDLGLPDRDGHTVIQETRGFSAVPIIVLSARSLEEQKIMALDAGADDYITKPFDSGELLARVRAVFRRSVRINEQSNKIQFGELQIDLNAREAHNAGGVVRFTPVEFRLLTCLAQGRGLMVTQNQLISEVWGPDRVDDSRSLRSYVKALRQKIEPDPSKPRYLITEPGMGYRLLV